MQDAKIGARPAQAEAIAIATQFLRDNHPAEDLSKITFSEVEPGFYAIARGDWRYAWMTIASAHGAKPRHFYFLDHRLVATAFPRPLWTGREYRDHYAIKEFDGGGRTSVEAGLRRADKVYEQYEGMR